MEQEKKELPSRSTRGKRLAALLEGEEAKADEEFWNQEFFKEEEGDQEYHSEGNVLLVCDV